MRFLPYPVPILGTIAVFVVGGIIVAAGQRFISSHPKTFQEDYRRRRLVNTVVIAVGAIILIGLWARLFQHAGTFLGLIGAGLAVALREPLLSIAGRIAIFAGHMYSVEDRIEISQLSGDVIDIGFLYTRMMEIGNWLGGDQYSGRIIQFANAQVFGTPVFNYTRNFAYIWDEVKLPITYASSITAATEILQEVGGTYTRDFLKAAQAQLDKMQRIFRVPTIELEPAVYLKVTDNWVELTLRYLVDPMKRRNASTFIFSEVFQRIQRRKDISIASSTMDLTMHEPSSGAKKQEEGPKAA